MNKLGKSSGIVYVHHQYTFHTPHVIAVTCHTLSNNTCDKVVGSQVRNNIHIRDHIKSKRRGVKEDFMEEDSVE